MQGSPEKRYDMGQSLIERFTYGNAGGVTPQEQILNEITEKSPTRQRAIISLAKQQIEVQKQTAEAIIKSNLAGAGIIVNEIAQQTQVLENTVHYVGEQLSKDIFSAADQMSKAVAMLGDRLCIELSEIHWQMVQQNATLEEILYVLQENRNNEARQLVRQGIRHYVNEEFGEAEERFKRAIEFDTTDYQVLMNLGYIEIHKNNLSEAFFYFRKALTLPENLDAVSKSRTLWAVARLHYAEKDYQKALSFADQSINLDSPKNPKKIFTSGIYAALSGNEALAAIRIKQAINLDPAFFTNAVIEPDLEGSREKIWELLSDLSDRTASKANNLSKEIDMLISQVNHNKGNSEYAYILSDISQRFMKNKQLLQKPSYSDIVQFLTNVTDLRTKLQNGAKIIPVIDQQIDRITELIDQKRKLTERLQEKRNQRQQLQTQIPREIDESGKTADLIVWSCLILYACPGLLIGLAGPAPAWAWRLGKAIIWPIVFLIGFIESRERAAVSAGISGLIIGGAIVAVLWGLLQSNIDSVRRKRESMQSSVSSCDKEISATQKDIDSLDRDMTNLRQMVAAQVTQLHIRPK